MKNYQITYLGSNPRFKNLNYEIAANSEREAVIDWYKQAMDQNYFPQDDGTIQDCDGYQICGKHDESIEFDCGFFVANEV